MMINLVVFYHFGFKSSLLDRLRVKASLPHKIVTDSLCRWNHDRTSCNLHGLSYNCAPVPGSLQFSRSDRAPLENCLSGENSWGVCSGGQFMCESSNVELLWKLAVDKADLGFNNSCSMMQQIFFFEQHSLKTSMILNESDVSRALSFLANSVSIEPDVVRTFPDVMLHVLSLFCPSQILASQVSVGGLARCCGSSWYESKSHILSAKVKLAAITICLNEEYILVFTVGALIEHVDIYILVDTGSTDRSIGAIQTIFPRQISAGKLLILNSNVGSNVSEARNIALGIARLHNCTHVLKVDADDVFYDAGAARLVRAVRSMPVDVQIVWLLQWEIFQFSIADTVAWLQYVAKDILWDSQKSDQRKRRFQFYRKTDIFGHDRIYALSDDLQARGAWADESRGLPSENFYHSSTGKFVFLVSDMPLMIHYGYVLYMKA